MRDFVGVHFVTVYHFVTQMKRCLLKNYVAENDGFLEVFVHENTQLQLGKFMWQSQSTVVWY